MCCKRIMENSIQERFSRRAFQRQAVRLQDAAPRVHARITEGRLAINCRASTSDFCSAAQWKRSFPQAQNYLVPSSHLGIGSEGSIFSCKQIQLFTKANNNTESTHRLGTALHARTGAALQRQDQARGRHGSAPRCSPSRPTARRQHRALRRLSAAGSARGSRRRCGSPRRSAAATQRSPPRGRCPRAAPFPAPGACSLQRLRSLSARSIRAAVPGPGAATRSEQCHRARGCDKAAGPHPSERGWAGGRARRCGSLRGWRAGFFLPPPPSCFFFLNYYYYYFFLIIFYFFLSMHLPPRPRTTPPPPAQCRAASLSRSISAYWRGGG